MTPEFPDHPATVRQLVGFAEKARKEGLLALEPAIAEVDDAFTKKGMQLTVDGTDPDLVREVLEVEIESMEARHRVGQKLFKDAGGYAPTIGVLGTVMGLLHVMQLLQTPELLGPAIAGAFMATLYGVGSANVIFMPTAGRLATLTQSEVLNRTLVIEGILAIQAGENPRVVSERLLGFLPPADREAAAAPGAPTLQAVPEAQAA
jgi:chemotaxis protein MotA